MSPMAWGRLGRGVSKTTVISGVLAVGLGSSLEGSIGLQPDGRAPRLQDRGCEVELVEQVRFGSVDGPGEYTFGQVEDLAVGPDGSIFVVDLHPQSILQFGPRGRFVRRIGRVGGGPGEYRSVVGISIFRDGRLAVWDSGNRRITVYDSSGAYLEGVRVARGVYAPDAFQVDTLGRFYVKIHAQLPSVTRQGRFTGVRYGYLKLSSDGAVLDSVSLPAENPTGTFLFSSASGVSLRPFPIQEVYALSPFGYLVVGSNERYAFTIRDPNRAVTVEREDFAPVMVNGDERREWQALAEYNERASGLSFPPIPETKPAFRSLWVDGDGRIWVHRYVEAVQRDLPRSQATRSGDRRPNITWQEPPFFDVYTSAGELLWCVALPWRARRMASRGSRLWGILKGSLDEDYVVGWRIARR